MTKLMTRLFGLLFVIAFFFCFTACDFGSHIDPGSGDVPITPPTGGGDDSEIVFDDNDEMFETDSDGNYVFFEEATNNINAVQVMSVPPKDLESSNPQTTTERQRFYEDVRLQFFVMSAYATKFLLGEFGGGTPQEQIKDDSSAFKNDYVAQIDEKTPTVRDQEIGDTNAFLIEQTLSGWTYGASAPNPVFSDEFAWKLSLGQTSILDNYSQTYFSTFQPFVCLRMIELASNQLYGTTFKTPFSEVNTTEKCQNMISSRLAVFKKLGFEFGELSDANSFAFGLKTFLLDEVIGSNAQNHAIASKTFSEPFQKASGNTGQGYEDGDNFNDINKNGRYDASFVSTTIQVVDFDQVVETIVSNLKTIADAFPKVDAMEVQGIKSKDFYTPGQPATQEGGKKTLNNLDYAQYKSAVFFPAQDFSFDSLLIFVDAQTDFKLKIWMKFCFEGGSFVAPICLMDLDSSRPYDFSSSISDFETDYDGDITDDDLFDQEIHEELFGSNTRHNSVMVPLANVLSKSQLAFLKSNGVKGFEGEIGHQQRGFHTNSQDNLELLNDYKFQDFEGSSLLSFAGNDNYIEFLFEIVDPNPELDQNFKFLIMPDTFWDEDPDFDFDDDFDDEDFSGMSFEGQKSLDYDKKNRENFNI